LRQTIATLLAVLLLAAQPHAARAADAQKRTSRITIVYDASYAANLYWLVNALAGYEHADSAAYRAWWQAHTRPDPADETHLATFRALRDTYRGQYLDSPDAATDSPIPVPPPHDADLATKFSALFMTSRTMDEVYGKAEVLLRDRDVTRLLQVFRHFDRRFSPSWPSLSYVADHAKRFPSQPMTRVLEDTLDRAAELLGVAPDASISVRVVFAFAGSRKVLHGNAFGGGTNLLVEIPKDPDPLCQADVVVHEVCHMLDREGGARESKAFMNAMLSTGLPSAIPALGLMSEGLATAIGQGVFQERTDPEQFGKRLTTPRSFYMDDAIDRYAKTILPVVKTAIEEKRSLVSIAPELVAGFERAFAGHALTPLAMLNNYVLVGGRRDTELFAPYFEVVPPRSLWHTSMAEAAGMLKRYAAATAVIPLLPEDLKLLEADRQALDLTDDEWATLRDGRCGVLTKKRQFNGFVFLVQAPDRQKLRDTLAKFGRMPRLQPGWTTL